MSPLILNTTPATTLATENAKINVNDNEPPINNIVVVIPITVKLIKVNLANTGFTFFLQVT